MNTDINRISNLIDHTILKPEATKVQLSLLCDEAKNFNFYSVCVNGGDVRFCVRQLVGTQVKVCSVVGFPLGRMNSAIKAAEARKAISDGASEIDMVIHVGALKDNDDELVKSDIHSVKAVCQESGVLLKVIIETGLLSREEKIKACILSENAGADFVKTCTGFSGGMATVEDVKLMRATVSPNVRVKASGGISTIEQAVALIEAGASRLGISKTVEKLMVKPSNNFSQNSK